MDANVYRGSKYELTLLQGILYRIIIPCVDYKLVKSNAECKSGDQSLGSFSTLYGCAGACRKNAQCTYFIYGINNKKGKCYWEKTSSRGCTDGWETDSYNFYKLESGKFFISDY